MRYVLALLTVLLAGTARAEDDLVLPQVDFAATDIQESGPIRIQESIHYTPGLLRIDRPNGFSSTILDFRTQTQYLLMANHTYLVLPLDDALFRRFIARTPDMTGATKVSARMLDGLEATKYAFGNDGALNAAGYYWITKTGIMLRREYDDGVFGANVHHVEYLTDLKIAPQPPALFLIPSSDRRVQ